MNKEKIIVIIVVTIYIYIVAMAICYAVNLFEDEKIQATESRNERQKKSVWIPSNYEQYKELGND